MNGLLMFRQAGTLYLYLPAHTSAKRIPDGSLATRFTGVATTPPKEILHKLCVPD
jgi:hypothetical protein